MTSPRTGFPRIAHHDGAARRTAGIAAPRRDITEHPPGGGGGRRCRQHRACLLRRGPVVRRPGHGGHRARPGPRPGGRAVRPRRRGERGGPAGPGAAGPLPRRSGHPEPAIRAARAGRGDHRAGRRPDGSPGLPLRRLRPSALHVRPLPPRSARGGGEPVPGLSAALAHRPAHRRADLGISGHHRPVPDHGDGRGHPVLVRGGEPLLSLRDGLRPQPARDPVRRDVHPAGHDGRGPGAPSRAPTTPTSRCSPRISPVPTWRWCRPRSPG